MSPNHFLVDLLFTRPFGRGRWSKIYLLQTTPTTGPRRAVGWQPGKKSGGVKWHMNHFIIANFIFLAVKLAIVLHGHFPYVPSAALTPDFCSADVVVEVGEINSELIQRVEVLVHWTWPWAFSKPLNTLNPLPKLPNLNQHINISHSNECFTRVKITK